MKQVLPILLLLLLAAGALTGGFMLWQRRPGRVVITVNGRPLTAQELAWRGETLFNDAKRDEHLAVTPDREAEAREHYIRSAAKAWVMKELLLAAAVARGVTVTPADEKEAIAQGDHRLKRIRGVTLEDYFNEGPLPRDVKERDFREGVLAGKFLKMEVEDKIKVTGQEIKSRTDELMRINLLTTKPGEKPKYKTDHKSVIALIRSERYARGVRELYKSLYATAQIVSHEYPELEKVEGVIPEKKTAAGAKRQ